ncbi:hypothetical protein [Nostoc sp.]
MTLDSVHTASRREVLATGVLTPLASFLLYETLLRVGKILANAALSAI